MPAAMQLLSRERQWRSTLDAALRLCLVHWLELLVWC